MPTAPVETDLSPAAYQFLKQHWGYDSFLPMQPRAIQAILNREDSLVILPTGAGKSLCYQLPVLMMNGTAVVISPLISLMKDQVDTLNSLGIPAGYLQTGMDETERAETRKKLRNGDYKLFYVAPERFESDEFMFLLAECNVAYFVIDESHCISQWGHDFRPAYRSLGRLREAYPHLGIHAFTATATPPVRRDIIRALNLSDCKSFVGDFDRPNLLYRVQYRNNLMKQVTDIIDRHPTEGGIIYCISRKDVDEMTASLKSRGYNVLPYHAGLSDIERKRNQEAFLNETVDIVVATVAFGMGIDRSNIRYVIHTGMPKSVENYQQEAGRAGRDRLEAECVLLFSGSDVPKWRTIMGRPETEYDNLALEKLFEMSNYCQRTICRHRFLVAYFGQDAEARNCGRCDTCLGEYEVVADSRTVALKILSCVARVEERFGALHVASVLVGGNTDKIRQHQHQKLSTYGLLADQTQGTVMNWIDQMLYAGLLERDPDRYNALVLTSEGRRFLKGEGDIALARPVEIPETQPKKSKEKGEKIALSADDEPLFQALRQVRKKLASEKRVAPFIIFSDVTLKDMARRRPTSMEDFRDVKGVGENKLDAYCPRFLEAILAFQY